MDIRYPSWRIRRTTPRPRYRQVGEILSQPGPVYSASVFCAPQRFRPLLRYDVHGTCGKFNHVRGWRGTSLMF